LEVVNIKKNNENPFAWNEAIQKIQNDASLHKDRPVQRQDSLTDQLKDLILIAESHGMYDAADYLKTVCKIK
jgi:hypothetical protein